MDEPTDLDLITDHPFQPGRPPLEADQCGWHNEGATLFPCGYSEAEHAERLEGAEQEVTPNGTP